MLDKILLPTHADKSKLRRKQLRQNIKYILILILKFLLLWDCSTIVQSSQGRAGTNAN